MTAKADSDVRRIALASDHAGFELKTELIAHLKQRGREPLDLGTNSTDSVDYPDYADRVASRVSRGEVKEGILICGTGIGMPMTANKYPNVRAAVATTPFMAKMSRAHNDANILCLGGRVVDAKAAVEILDAWLREPFEGGRHERRVAKIRAHDRELPPCGSRSDSKKK